MKLYKTLKQSHCCLQRLEEVLTVLKIGQLIWTFIGVDINEIRNTWRQYKSITFRSEEKLC